MNEKTNENFLPQSGIPMKLKIDPEYINKAKESICKDCIHNVGFGHEFYLCDIGMLVKVKYKKEGIFHTEITECDHYETKP